LLRGMKKGGGDTRVEGLKTEKSGGTTTRNLNDLLRRSNTAGLRLHKKRRAKLNAGKKRRDKRAFNHSTIRKGE